MYEALFKLDPCVRMCLYVFWNSSCSFWKKNQIPHSALLVDTDVVNIWKSQRLSVVISILGWNNTSTCVKNSLLTEKHILLAGSPVQCMEMDVLGFYTSHSVIFFITLKTKPACWININFFVNTRESVHFCSSMYFFYFYCCWITKKLSTSSKSMLKWRKTETIWNYVFQSEN